MTGDGTVFVVDDDAAVRDSLGILYGASRLPVQTFASAEQFLRAYEPDWIGCLILDLKMPGLSGAELQQELALRGCQLPIVFLTAHATVETSVRAIKRGAAHFLAKPFDPAELVALTEDILRSTLARQQQWCSLSEREREVLVMLAADLGTKAIAAELAISARTVEGHRAHLMRKLGVHTLVELANASHRFDLTAYRRFAHARTT